MSTQASQQDGASDQHPRQPIGIVGGLRDGSGDDEHRALADAVLQEVAEEFLDRGIRLYIANVKGPVREVMHRSGLYQKLGANRFFYTIDAAVRRALAEA